MANITLNENPQLNLEMEAMTVNTEGHCDEWNRRHKQLLENDHYLSEEQKKNNEPEFTVAEKRENIASKEKMPKILGKIAKFFTDLKTVAFSGKYSDLDGKPAIVNNNTATEAGSALDARQANPTIEGTMANQISQLNSDLSGLNGNLELSECYNATVTNATGTVAYKIKNGICYVCILRVIPNIKGLSICIASNLPKPAVSCMLPIINNATTTVLGNMYHDQGDIRMFFNLCEIGTVYLSYCYPILI